MVTSTQTAGLLTPQQLRKLAQETAISEQQKAAAEAKKAEEDKEAVRKAFMDREIRPDAMEYLMVAVKRHAEAGKHEFLVFQFPAELLSDGGRRVNNFEPDWPDSLQGFSKRAYDYYQEHLKPAGYHLRAQVLEYPHGNLGDVGLYLCW
jgi:hypothetical protein